MKEPAPIHPARVDGGSPPYFVTGVDRFPPWDRIAEIVAERDDTPHTEYVNRYAELLDLLEAVDLEQLRAKCAACGAPLFSVFPTHRHTERADPADPYSSHDVTRAFCPIDRLPHDPADHIGARRDR